MALSANARPIAGAVATQGVSDRVTFLRKTYAHLGGALVAFALVTAAIMKYATSLSLKMAGVGSQGMMGFVFVLIAFVAINYFAQKLAMSESSRGLQYVGLGVAVVLWSFIAQPIIWFTVLKFGNSDALMRTADGGLEMALSPRAALVLGEATIVTLAIFLGLTLTVFITKKDFTFLRGMLSVATFALIGIGLASMLFGFDIGMIYSGLVIALMAGYILYQTSLILGYFRPTQFVAAALMLFTSVVTLFIQVLNILAQSQRR
jgi:FtsH-binding integral membrane protein